MVVMSGFFQACMSRVNVCTFFLLQYQFIVIEVDASLPELSVETLRTLIICCLNKYTCTVQAVYALYSRTSIKRPSIKRPPSIHIEVPKFL